MHSKAKAFLMAGNSQKHRESANNIGDACFDQLPARILSL